MLLFLEILVISGITVKLLPSIKLRGIFIVYFLILYILLSGIEGLVTVNPQDKISANAIFLINQLIIILHLPLIYHLYRLDHKKHLTSARDLFGEHVWHLDDKRLHKHLRK